MNTPPVRHEATPTPRTPANRPEFAKQAPTPTIPTEPPPMKASEQVIPPSNLPTTEEAANNPLVKAVLETFNGTVKQVYPRK